MAAGKTKDVPIGAWIVGIINIVGGVLGLLGSLIAFIIGSTGLFGLMSVFMGNSVGNMAGGFLLGGIWLVVLIIGIVMSIFSIIVGVYTIKLKNWARIAATILAVLSLLSFPIGTIIGLIELYFLWVHEETKNAFE